MANTFYYEAKQRQIPLAELRGNPFVFHRPDTAPPEAPAPKQASEPPKDNHQERELADALAAARQLTLQSVLVGAHGATAMISNNLLTEGAQINGWTVKAVRAREVTLAWKDQEHVLTMPQ